MPKSKNPSLTNERAFGYPDDAEVTQGIRVGELVKYQAFLTGNDKPLTSSELERFRIGTPFVLLGTSMIRSVDLACSLMSSTDNTPPKVMIIDNSQEVIESWGLIKDYFKTVSDTQACDSDFYEDFMDFLMDIDNDLIIMDSKTGGYFVDLFKRLPLQLIRSVILETLVIPQSWSNQGLFSQIKHVYDKIPIVTYTSNILPFLDTDHERRAILQNLQLLQPAVNIFSNLEGDLGYKRPTKTFVGCGCDALDMCILLGLPEILAVETADYMPSADPRVEEVGMLAADEPDDHNLASFKDRYSAVLDRKRDARSLTEEDDASAHRTTMHKPK